MMIQTKYGKVSFDSDGKINFNKTLIGTKSFYKLLDDKEEIESKGLIAKLFPKVCEYVFSEYENKTYKGGQGQTITRTPAYTEVNRKSLMNTTLPITIIDGYRLSILYRTFSPPHIDSTSTIISIDFEIIPK